MSSVRKWVTAMVVVAACLSCRKADKASSDAAGQPAAAGLTKRDSSAIAGVTSWLALVDEGQYGESWDAAAQVFQGGVTRENWLEGVGAVRVPLGKLVSRMQKSSEAKTTLPGVPDGIYLLMQFDSAFEQKPVAVETVTVKQGADGSWKVAGYFIR